VVVCEHGQNEGERREDKGGFHVGAGSGESWVSLIVPRRELLSSQKQKRIESEENIKLFDQPAGRTIDFGRGDAVAIHLATEAPRCAPPSTLRRCRLRRIAKPCLLGCQVASSRIMGACARRVCRLGAKLSCRPCRRGSVNIAMETDIQH
jgi:hypothetical protein